MDVDENTLELLERRMSERIEKQVRNRLLAPLALVVGVVGFFGYDVVSGMRDAAISAAEEQVEPVLAEAEVAVADARAEVLSARSMLSTLTDWMAERTQKLSEVEDEVQGRVADAAQTATALQATLDNVRQRIAETDNRIDAQESRADSLYAGAGNLTDLANQLTQLAEQVREIDREIERLSTERAGPSSIDLPETAHRDSQVAQKNLEQVINTTREIAEQRTLDSPSNETIFLQFSGVARDVAESLSAGLQEQGYSVPGEERIEAAEGKHHIRYFFEQDYEAAGILAEHVNRLLSASGYKDNVQPQDLTSYRGTKPKPGVLELWIEPEPR